MDDIFHFDAKATYRYDPIHKRGEAKESVEFYKDAQRTDKLGKLAGVFSRPQNPFIGLNVPCTRQNLASDMKVLPPVLPLTSGLAARKPGTAQQGLVQATDEPYSWPAFVDKWKELGKARMRLTGIETFTVGKDRRYIGIWREGRDAYYLWRVAGWKAFTDKWAELAKKKLRLIDVETFVDGTTRYYVGVWREGQDGYALWPGEGWPAFSEKWAERSKQNLRLTDVETSTSGNRRHYIGVWRSGQDGHYLWQAKNWGDFVAKWQQLGEKNLRLIAIKRP